MSSPPSSGGADYAWAPGDRLSLVEATETTLEVAWPPADGAVADHVEVDGAARAPTTETSVTLTGLAPGTTYRIEVSAERTGASPGTLVGSFTTPADRDPVVTRSHVSRSSVGAPLVPGESLDLEVWAEPVGP